MFSLLNGRSRVLKETKYLALNSDEAEILHRSESPPSVEARQQPHCNGLVCQFLSIHNLFECLFCPDPIRSHRISEPVQYRI